MVVLAHLGGMSTAGGRSASGFGGPEAVVQAAERGWGPPVRAPEQGHQSRDEQSPYDEGVDQDGGGAGRAGEKPGAPSTADGTAVKAAHRLTRIVASAG